ncbi:MAG: glycoside hydrolase family 32 protein [Niabella sp.]
MKRNLLFVALQFAAVFLYAQPEAPTPQWRPVYHFTPEKNWTNDPNGLIYLNGTYHLYNQQNPFENRWGHMSWGHATSTDLIHWKHLPLAIPETIDGKDTLWRFSGSAVWDKHNTSGWCKNENCIVAVYTVHEPHRSRETQYVAYSNDGGATFTNYDQNPVIDLEKLDFRDPNVFWYEPGKFWLMSVVLPAEHKVQFYRSDNLRQWDLLSEFGPQGYTGANWECPFLIELPVIGKPKQTKWVLVLSAAGGAKGVFQQYFIGDFDGQQFKNDNAADSIFPLDYGDSFYASIPWNHLPANQKTYIGWMIPNPQPTSPWRGQMSIPRDLSLKETKNGIRLVQQPAAVISSRLSQFSHNRIFTVKNLSVNNTDSTLSAGNITGNNCYWLKAELNVQAGAVAGLKLTQEKDASGKVIHETIIGYDAEKKQLFVDRTNSGGQLNQDKIRQVINIAESDNKVELEILLDKSSLEVFVNKGLYALSTSIYPNERSTGIAAFAANGNAVIKNLRIRDMHQQ